MKTPALAALLLLLTLATRAQDAWPRNSKTGKVEFTGTLRWPASAKTEAQRKAAVRRWYLKRLTDQSAAVVEEEARTVVSPTLLTYDKLPISVVIGNASPPNPGILAYIVTLRPAARGLAYTFAEFAFSRGDTNEPGTELEQVLTANPPTDRPALAALRKRLAAAVAGW